MLVNYSIVGMDGREAAVLARLLCGHGRHSSTWTSLLVDPDAVVAAGSDLVLLDAREHSQSAIALAGILAERLEVVLMARRPGVEVLRQAMRAGCCDVVDPEREPVRLRQIVRDIRRRRVGRQRQGRVFGVLGCHGGVGTTTVALSLAGLLSAAPGRKVVVTDLDHSSGDLAAHLGLPPGSTTHDLVARFERLPPETLDRWLRRHADGYWVLPQPTEGLDSTSITGPEAETVVTALVRVFSHTVVDLGSSLGESARQALLDTDHVVLVATQEAVPLRRARRRLALLAEMGIDRSRLHVVLNRYDRRRHPTVVEASAEIGHPVTTTIANDYDAVEESRSYGASVVVARPRAAASRDLRALAVTLLEGRDRVAAEGTAPLPVSG